MDKDTDKKKAADDVKNDVAGDDAGNLGTDAASTGDATGDKGGDGAADEPRFTQSQLDAIIEDRLARAERKRERERAEAERRAKEEARLALEEEAKKRGDLETQLKLAQDHVAELQSQVAEMGALQERMEALEALLQQIYDGRVESLTEGGQRAVQSLPEGMTIEQRLRWLDDNAETFLKMPASGGVPASPAGDKRPVKTTDEQKRELAAGVRSYW